MTALSIRSRARGLAKAVPPPIRHAIRRIGFALGHPRRLARTLGAGGALRYAAVPAWREIRQLAGRGKTTAPDYVLTAADATHPVWCRAGSSDPAVFRQIFIDREYGCVGDLQDPRVLIDCGANVGYATAWFLSRYPSLRSVSVEPDPENAAMLRRNLAPYGDRAGVVETGVWSRPAHLRIVLSAFGDQREWATQVAECDLGEPHDLVATDIPTLIERVGAGRVDVLKIDIEGSEGDLFADGAPKWLSAVDNLVVEIHGPELERILDDAIPASEFARFRSGDLTHYRRHPRRTRLV